MAKTLRVSELHAYLAKFAPPNLAEDWDNVGLQVGSLSDKISHVLVSLDVTEAVLWEAVEHDANLLVTHHPLFMQAIQCLDDSTVSTRLARLATQMDVNVLSFHTNLDSTHRGLNDLLAKALSLKSTKPLMPSLQKNLPKAGLGRLGKIPKTTLGSLMKTLGGKLSLKAMRYVGDLKQPIQTVAVLTGSGGGYFREAKLAGADVLITGDVKYHHALDSLSEGIALIDIGHFAGEIGMVELVAKKLRAWIRNKKAKIKIFETQAQSDPIQLWKK